MTKLVEVYADVEGDSWWQSIIKQCNHFVDFIEADLSLNESDEITRVGRETCSCLRLMLSGEQVPDGETFAKLKSDIMFLITENAFGDVIERVVAFGRNILPYIQDLLYVYSDWIEANSESFSEKEFENHDKMFDMLKRLEDNSAHLASVSNPYVAVLCMFTAAMEVYDKVTDAETCPPFDVLRDMMAGYPELRQFMDDIFSIFFDVNLFEI